MIFFVSSYRDVIYFIDNNNMGNGTRSPRVPFKFKENSYIAVVVIKKKRPTQIRYKVLRSILELQSRPNYANPAKEIFVEIS